MNYTSTRGAQNISFTDALMAGLAPDGGLYIPTEWPRIDFAKLVGRPYAEIAFTMLRPFIGEPEFDDVTLKSILDATYTTPNFDHRAIAPLVELGPDLWLLELFHGPTLSFKDYALQLIGRLFDHVLKKQDKRITILGATSGDTGSAAIAACAPCANITLTMLHPKGRVSEVQRLQMTTVDSPNIRNVAIDGTFDDCQALVKQAFADQKLREDLNLAAVNSINWARILAQTVYYAAAALALGGPSRPVSFTVPTGNFGNVFAGHAARLMGLHINSLTIATNRNDILTRFFASGAMEKHGAEESLSPAMDIEVASNFERYLYLLENNASRVATLMEEFQRTGRYEIPQDLMAQAQKDFRAARCSDEETLESMRRAHAETGLLIDPHTAVALHVAKPEPGVPHIILSTAHPAKFGDAVKRATGIAPELPPALRNLSGKKEHLAHLPNDLGKLKDFLRAQ